jgi:hypothetical protein
MSKSNRNADYFPMDDAFVAIKKRKRPPHEFVLDALAPLAPRTHSMFGCLAVYVGEKIVIFLREKPSYAEDNGVWLATQIEHHESLRREFPNMRSIRVLGKEPTGWQVLPSDSADFEEAALRACELILAGDPRIGKIPGARRRSASKPKKPARTARRPSASNKMAAKNRKRRR